MQVILPFKEEIKWTPPPPQKKNGSEWVPSEWESKQLIKNITVIHK